jgi:phosphate transport system substrate-binding protein
MAGSLFPVRRWVFSARAFFALSLCMVFLACPAHAQVLRVVGALTVVPPVSDAVGILKKEKSITLQIFPVLNASADKIQALGEGRAEVAMFARPLTAADRAPYPDLDFQEFQFGAEAATLVVSKDVWDAGVHALTRAQARGIYEEKIKNWKELGGPDLPIILYTPQPSRGIWDCYIQWIYEDPTMMRENRFAMNASDDEARTDLESTPGSITPVSMLYASANKLHSLAVKDDDGTLVQPSAAAIANHTYPMARPMIMVVKGRPLGIIETFVKFMVSDRGQDLVHKYNYLTLKELGVPPPSF